MFNLINCIFKVLLLYIFLYKVFIRCFTSNSMKFPLYIFVLNKFSFFIKFSYNPRQKDLCAYLLRLLAIYIKYMVYNKPQIYGLSVNFELIFFCKVIISLIYKLLKNHLTMINIKKTDHDSYFTLQIKHSHSVFAFGLV